MLAWYVNQLGAGAVKRHATNVDCHRPHSDTDLT
jgi:hypothetical protein